MDMPQRPVQYFQPELGRMGSVSAPETLADHLTGVGNNHKGMGIGFPDHTLKPAALLTAHGGHDDGVILVGIDALCPVGGGRTVQIFHNEPADGIGIIGDDGEGLAQVHVLHHEVDGQALGTQTQQGEQSGGGAEGREGSGRR